MKMYLQLKKFSELKSGKGIYGKSIS